MSREFRVRTKMRKLREDAKMTSIAYIDLIENFLSSELHVGLEDGAVLACNSLTEDQLRLFSSHFHDVDSGQHDLMARPNAPLGPSMATQDNDMGDQGQTSDITPTSAMFTHPYNGLAPVATDHLKRQLLFFSRVAVVVPELALSRDLHESREKDRKSVV